MTRLSIILVSLIWICCYAKEDPQIWTYGRQWSRFGVQKETLNRHIRSAWIGIEGKIRGEAAIRSMPTSKISKMLRVIDRLREGRVNIRDLDRRDINSINKLLESYGVTQ